MSQYLAIGQVCIARDVAELFIAKLANVALQLEACEGACHAPEADVPSPCMHTSRSVALVKERKKEKTLLLGMFQGEVTVSPSFPLAEAQHSEGKGGCAVVTGTALVEPLCLQNNHGSLSAMAKMCWI